MKSSFISIVPKLRSVEAAKVVSGYNAGRSSTYEDKSGNTRTQEEKQSITDEGTNRCRNILKLQILDQTED
jgi:hypothetical protein